MLFTHTITLPLKNLSLFRSIFYETYCKDLILLLQIWRIVKRQCIPSLFSRQFFTKNLVGKVYTGKFFIFWLFLYQETNLQFLFTPKSYQRKVSRKLENITKFQNRKFPQRHKLHVLHRKYKMFHYFNFKRQVCRSRYTVLIPRTCKRRQILFHKSLLSFLTWREYFYSQPKK